MSLLTGRIDLFSTSRQPSRTFESPAVGPANEQAFPLPLSPRSQFLSILKQSFSTGSPVKEQSTLHLISVSLSSHRLKPVARKSFFLRKDFYSNFLGRSWLSWVSKEIWSCEVLE